MGELFAFLSAFGFGLGGAAVAKGAPTARGDNGVFLSILLTLALSALLWLTVGIDLATIDETGPLLTGIGWFVASGVLAIVFGRLTNFRSIALSGAIRASVFRRLIPVFSTLLAFILLGERYAPPVLLGMLLIVASIVIVIRANPRKPRLSAAELPAARLRLGLILGAVSAFCYALAYVARKLAMEGLPDPALGALIGALTGVVWYALAAPVSLPYRRSVFRVFHDAGRWQWIAALGMSMGQILLFFALLTAPVAVVAIIWSLETFVAAYLAAFLFKSEPVPGRPVILATVIAVFGVVLVALS